MHRELSTDPPKVSVIMSVYNGERYLQPAIESILTQTYSEYEFIIIDDASVDGTRAILNNFKDDRIRCLYNKQNHGLAKSLNRAISISRGAYLARQDADDLSMPNRFYSQVNELDRNPALGFVGTSSQWINEDGVTIRNWKQPTGNSGIQETMLKYCMVVHGSTMIRRSALDEVGGGYTEEYKTGQDHDLWLRLTEHWDARILDETLYKYRWHEEMASKKDADKQLINSRTALKDAINRRSELARLHLLHPFTRIPSWAFRFTRKEWAQRFLWWSAGARKLSRAHSAFFLLVSLRLDPFSADTLRYIGGIASRKVGAASQ